jgi:ketosteroid isomerase-like protein
MKGKVSILLVGLMLCLWTFLAGVTPLHAKEWTAEQKEIVNWFKKYTEVSVEGNLEGIWSYYHPKFSGWDYSQIMNEGVPFDKAWLQNSHKELYKNNKMISFEVEPLEIKIEGNFAIIHVNFVEKLQDSDGNEITYSGPWTSALIKQDGKWLFISWSFAFK